MRKDSVQLVNYNEYADTLIPGEQTLHYLVLSHLQTFEVCEHEYTHPSKKKLLFPNYANLEEIGGRDFALLRCCGSVRLAKQLPVDVEGGRPFGD